MIQTAPHHQIVVVSQIPALETTVKLNGRIFGLGNESRQSAKSEGWFLGLTAIGNQPADEIDQKVDWTAASRMLNLRNILELVNDGFHKGAFAQQDFVHQRHEHIFHVLASSYATILPGTKSSGLFTLIRFQQGGGGGRISTRNSQSNDCNEIRQG